VVVRFVDIGGIVQFFFIIVVFHYPKDLLRPLLIFQLEAIFSNCGHPGWRAMLKDTI